MFLVAAVLVEQGRKMEAPASAADPLESPYKMPKNRVRKKRLFKTRGNASGEQLTAVPQSGAGECCLSITGVAASAAGCREAVGRQLPRNPFLAFRIKVFSKGFECGYGRPRTGYV